MGFRLKIKGLDEALEALEDMQDALEDFGPVMDEAAELLEGEAQKALKEGKSPEGTSWAPLSKTTREAEGKRSRATLGGSSGKVAKSIASEAKPLGASVSTRGIGAIHQSGAPGNRAWGRGRAPIPARPFIPQDLSPELAEELGELLLDHVEEAWDE